MTILEALLAGIILYLLFHFGARWIVSIMSERIVAKLMSPEPTLNAELYPESQFIIQVTDIEIACQRPDGSCEKVAWDDLQKVEILTTSDGPFAPDVLWLLHGKDKGCVIPQGATGDSELLELLQRLPGFDNTRFMQAMGSTSETSFICWEKTQA